jgi:SulP family sulfate permease
MFRKFSFSFSNFRGDLLGGLTAGVVALPLALAFGIQSGLGASAGLYGAIFLGIFASVFGGTKTQVSGPTGPMTVVSSTVVALAIKEFGGLESGLWFVLLVFLMAGFFQVLFGIFRLGQYIRYIPYPVISGFMSGIGLIILALQVFPAMGLASPQTVIGVFSGLGEGLKEMNLTALLLTIGTLAIIYLLPLVSKKLPATLTALLAGALAVYLFKWEVPVIGSIPSGLPVPHISSFANIDPSKLLLVIGPALTLAGLGSIDTLLTSLVNDNITRTRHQSNRELIGQGIGNMIASIFGGLPGAGATMRTLVNINSGGKTRLSGILHGIFLFLTVVGLGFLVKHIPIAVLAGILISVGIGIIDKKGLSDILKIPKADAAVMIVVLLLTVFVNLIEAVGIGMIIASVLFMKRIGDLADSKVAVEPVKQTNGENPWADEQSISSSLSSKIYIVHLDGPVFFGGLNRFQSVVNDIPKEVEAVIFRMKRVPFLDQSGAYAMETALNLFIERNVEIYLTAVQVQPRYMLERIGIIPGLVSRENLFPNLTDCIMMLEQKEIKMNAARQTR